MQRKAGIYIHIPFCVRKCNYCAFLSFNAEESPRKEYSEALIREIELRARQYEGRKIDTVYFGGGTPSVMDISQMSLIFKALRKNFDMTEAAESFIDAVDFERFDLVIKMHPLTEGNIDTKEAVVDRKFSTMDMFCVCAELAAVEKLLEA
jgi:coproporphyrinogen III oxidase-like Fe-S oxidoreductase